MDLLTLVIILVCVGVLYGAITKWGGLIGLEGTPLRCVQIAIIVVTVLWLLNLVGVFTAVRSVTVPHVR